MKKTVKNLSKAIYSCSGLSSYIPLLKLRSVLAFSHQTHTVNSCHELINGSSMLILIETGLGIKLVDGAQSWEMLCDFNTLLRKLIKRGHLKESIF